MAALAGVAQSTVSYVMSGNRPISQKTRDKVEKAMWELGYVPDAHARAMISNRSHIIGLLTETTETTQGAELFPILRAIRATAKEHGYDLILMSSTCTTEDLADMRRLGKGNLVDAFIMLDIRHHDERLKSAMKLGLPIVPYGDPGEPYHYHCVDSDTKAIVGMAFWEMHAIGAKKAVIVKDPRGDHEFPFINLRPGERHMRRTAWDTAGTVRGADREVPGVEGQRRVHLHPLAADAGVDRADDAAHRRRPRQGHRTDRRGRSKSPSSRSKARNSSPA